MSSPSSGTRRSPRSRQTEPSSDARPLQSSGISATSTPSRRDPLATSQQTPSSKGVRSAPHSEPRTMSIADRHLGSESSPLRYSQTPVKSQGGTPGLTPSRRSDISRSRRPQFFDASIHSEDDRMQIQQGSQDAPSDRIESSGDNNAARNFGRAVIWGTNVNVQETFDAFKRFLNDFRDEESGEFFYTRLLEEIHATERFFLELDCMHLSAFDRNLYVRMVRYPQEIIPIFDMVADDVYRALIGQDPVRPIQVRTFNLEATKNMRLLNPEDVDQLISISGMVIRTSTVIPDLKEAFFRCSVCHDTKTVTIDRGRIDEPARCEACDTMRSMQLVHNRCVFADKQMIKLQETPEMIPEGQTPHTALLLAYDDLVDFVQPGDRIQVTGVYRATPLRVNPRDRTLKSIYKIHIDVVHVKKTDKRRMARAENDDAQANNIEDRITPERESELKALSRRPDIYDRLTRAFAPSIWELADIKKGILCQLFGGTNKVMKEAGKGRLRGEVNILLCGDPGTSKSQLLQYVHKLAPRGIYTSGKGSSSVGLTAYVTKDPESKQLVLESGALVLSDGGICCIDEFDKMNDSTRSVLHEAMEQQTVSIAKAGIICTLNARTSILAAANPRESRWNRNVSIVENIQLSPTILSRFDLIYLILDQPNEQHDRRLAQHIVGMYQQNDRDRGRDAEDMDLETLTDYISYARKHIQPALTDDAMRTLVEGYGQMRKLGGNKRTITATPRQLESLIRLSEALARMRFSQTVEESDVQEAIRLVRVALQDSATDPRTGLIDMDLITTGVSAFSRSRIADLANELRGQLSKSAAPMIKLGDVYAEMSRTAPAEVPQDQFLAALKELEDIGFITVTGRGADKMVRIL